MTTLSCVHIVQVCSLKGNCQGHLCSCDDKWESSVGMKQKGLGERLLSNPTITKRRPKSRRLGDFSWYLAEIAVTETLKPTAWQIQQKSNGRCDALLQVQLQPELPTTCGILASCEAKTCNVTNVNTWPRSRKECPHAQEA